MTSGLAANWLSFIPLATTSWVRSTLSVVFGLSPSMAEPSFLPQEPTNVQRLVLQPWR